MFRELLYRFGGTGSVAAKPHGDMAYRPEIDGLRALAVFPVIFFHAHMKFFGVELFKGGYVGVDIFFVISGYLIAGIIFDELERDSFSLARFYERRARRILPALLLVTAASVAVGLLVMTPEPFVEFSRSIFAVIFFVANIFFYMRDNYFAEPSELTPLLHTWSSPIHMSVMTPLLHSSMLAEMRIKLAIGSQFVEMQVLQDQVASLTGFRSSFLLRLKKCTIRK
jgi:peptidoglycan/LPS O-acetylase OafA/YrhL